MDGMDRQHELDLIALAQAGDESAMATLVEYHRGFAVSQAHKYITVRSKYVRESVNAAWHIMAQVQQVLKTINNESTGEEDVGLYADDLSDGHSEATHELQDLREHVRYIVTTMRGTTAERLVARYLWVEGKSIIETAEIMGVTRQRVDQLRAAVLPRLKINLCKTR